jgi:pimeloyl-ACP methyl ester carboxylesterase
MTCSNAVLPAARLNPAQPAGAVRVNGVELRYTDTDTGTSTSTSTPGGAPTILLHGGMGDLESWPHQIRALSPRHRVIAYSRRRSHPNRNDDVQRASFAECVDDDIDDLFALQGTLHVGPAHLVGTSYGALLALAAAMRAPDRVFSLVLAEPPLHRWACATEAGERLYGAFIEGVWRTAGDAFEAGLPRRAMQLLNDGMWGRPVFESWPDDHLDAVMRNAAAMHALTRSHDPFPEFDRSAVAGLRMPTLLLQGECTSALHRQVMNELGSVMPDARRVEIAFAGHGLPNENPEAFNAAVVSFLASLRHSPRVTR